MSLKAARADAAAKRASLKDKNNRVDPLAERDAKREEQERDAAAEAERQLAIEQSNHVQASAPTVDDLFNRYDAAYGATLEPHNRAVTRSRWKCHVSLAIGALKSKDATKQPVMAHYNEAVKAGKNSTPRAALSLLVRVMKWAEQNGYADDNHPLLRLQVPAKSNAVRQDQLPENFSAKEFLAKHGKEVIGQDGEDDKAGRALQFSELVILLQDILPRSAQAETGKCMIRLMLATGIRASETTRIRWDWISLGIP